MEAPREAPHGSGGRQVWCRSSRLSLSPVEAESTVHCPSDLFSLLGVAGLVRRTGSSAYWGLLPVCFLALLVCELRLSGGCTLHYKTTASTIQPLRYYTTTTTTPRRSYKATATTPRKSFTIKWTCNLGIINDRMRDQVSVCVISQLLPRHQPLVGRC